uniref:Ribonuclease H-like domain-containing protein n=1 Tax=Tanacetum cinerariifolium TaxID=118510 RepID=A0A6L2L6D6_TANCI|nr:ribonuclease H-like domain-containing protein [Tanacetum cinerariifolium]
MSDHEDEIITEENAPPKVVPQIITGNSAKSMTTDNDGNLKIRPPVTAEEHQHVKREEKARIILLFSLPNEHMGDFYHMIDARDIWNAIKARFEEGLDKGYDKMPKILTQMNTLKIKPELKDVNIKFLRGFPLLGLIDTKGYSSSSSTLSNAAFVSTDGSSQGNLSYQESGNGGYTTTLSVSPGSSSSKGSLKSKCSIVDDVIYSFFVNHEIDEHLVYEDLDQMNKEEFKEYDLKHQMAMLSIKNYKSKEAGKDGSDSKAMVFVDGSIDWDKQTEAGNTEPRSLENFGMIAGIKIESDADSEGEVVSADDAIPAGVSVSAGDVAAAVVSPQYETEFALMGLSTEDNSLRLEKAKDRGKISRKGTIKTKNLNFENVLYVKELQHFNLISVSQICDQTHRVLFIENECLVLSKDFPLLDPCMVILSIPRMHNLYTFSLNDLAPKGPDVAFLTLLNIM